MSLRVDCSGWQSDVVELWSDSVAQSVSVSLPSASLLLVLGGGKQGPLGAADAFQRGRLASHSDNRDRNAIEEDTTATTKGVQPIR